MPLFPRRPAPGLGQITHLGVVISYRILRSRQRRRTIGIVVHPVDGVRVLAPLRISEREIRDLVLKRASWILRASAVAARTLPPPKQFTDGESFPYRGVLVPLAVIPCPEPRTHASLLEGSLHLSLPQNTPMEIRAPLVARTLDRWFRERAADELAESIERWGQAMSVKPKHILIRNQRTLWGSCAADGTIRFNWRVIQVAPDLLDYVVVHELAHLKHRNHSPRFWEEVHAVIPDYLERRKRLRLDGRSLGL